jgi:cytochrome oxidase assembly protein ShyY1
MQQLFSWRVLSFGFVILLAEICFLNLANWQWGRYQEKEQKSSIYAEVLAQPIAQNLSGELKPWQRIKLSGKWQTEDTVFITNQRLSNRYALRVFTPLLVENVSVWVDRGLMLHTPNTKLPDMAALANPLEVKITGILKQPVHRTKTWGGPSANRSEKEFLLVDLEAMPQPKLAHLFPLYIQTDSTTHTEITPQITPPNSGSSRHLNYFITWLFLAILTPILTLNWFWRVQLKR